MAKGFCTCGAPCPGQTKYRHCGICGNPIKDCGPNCRGEEFGPNLPHVYPCPHFDGIQGSAGEFSHLVLEHPGQRVRVTPEGDVEIDGEIITEPRDIGEAFLDWARFMGASQPAGVLSEHVTANGRRPQDSVYVAGGSEERLTVVRPMIEALAEHGIHVTYDWTRSPGYDRPLTPAEVRNQARLDLEGVRAAGLVWIMAPEGKSEGCATELGAALALGKMVFLSGPHALRESRIFATLGSRIFATHAAAFRAITG